jgi:hypothetical protein
MYIKTDLDGGINWIYLAQDRDRWQTLANATMNFMSSIKCRKLLD